GQDDVHIRDGSGDSYAPLPGVNFASIHQGIALEFTLLTSDTYRLVVMDAASANVIAVFDNRLLAGAGPIQSVALYDSQTEMSEGEYDGNQLFNNMEVGPPASPVAPLVTVNPASIVAASGSTAVFTANATGTAPLDYQWQFNGVNQ